MPIPQSIPGSETANHVFRDLRAERISGCDVSTWAAELRREGFGELADAIERQLRREPANDSDGLRAWRHVAARSRALITPDR